MHRWQGQEHLEDRPPSFHEATAAYQRQLLQDALVACDGDPGLTARRLGLSRHVLATS